MAKETKDSKQTKKQPEVKKAEVKNSGSHGSCGCGCTQPKKK